MRATSRSSNGRCSACGGGPWPQKSRASHARGRRRGTPPTGAAGGTRRGAAPRAHGAAGEARAAGRADAPAPGPAPGQGRTGPAGSRFEASAPAAPAPSAETAPPPARPPSVPVRSRRPAPAGPPHRTGGARGVDWERWIGVRGAAVVAGILLALAGVYFVRYSIENGWLSPTVRVALGLLTGLAALVGSELLRRRDYEDASNGLAGGGIVVLYAAVWAARSLYGLIPVALAFALMVLITAVCGLLAWRRTSLVVALLGLIGGFATPLLVSAETSSPLGLFGYLLLLNAGLLFLGRRRGWAIIPPLGLLATLFYEGLWIFGDMTPSELPLALAILTLFAALFVFALVKAVPAAAGAAEPRRVWVSWGAAPARRRCCCRSASRSTSRSGPTWESTCGRWPPCCWS